MATTEAELQLFPPAAPAGASDDPAHDTVSVGAASSPVVAALLAQLGGHASRRFAEQVAELDLGAADGDPPAAGLRPPA